MDLFEMKVIMIIIIYTITGTTPADISFVTGRGECVEKTIAWKIENFSEFLKMSNKELEENAIVFEAGKFTLNNGTRPTVTWKYYFWHTKEDDEDWVGGFLQLDTSAISEKAWHSVSLSSGGKPITSFTAERDEFEYGPYSGRGNAKLITKAELLQKTEGDVLEVTLLIKVFSNRFKPVQMTSSYISEGQWICMGKLRKDLVKMLESGDGADVKIKVRSEVGKESSVTKMAHKGILMSRSSVFAKMFAKNSTMTEAQTGVVVIEDLSPKGLDIFLRYLYTGEVLDDWVHVLPEILNAAEKHDCGELKQYCGFNILDAVSTRNALEVYKLTKFHGLFDAAEKVLGFISMNAKAIIDQVVGESK